MLENQINGALTLLLSIITMLILTACYTPKGNIQNGERWYTMHNCYACHGKNANDGRATKISAINMEFSSFVRFLRKPDSPSMPPFSESTVSKEDAADIYAWLKSMPK